MATLRYTTLLLLTIASATLAWMPPAANTPTRTSTLLSASNRRNFFIETTTTTAAATAAATLLLVTTTPTPPALALVKGNAPPPKQKKAERKCTNVDECQAMAEIRDQDRREEEDLGPPALVTKGGTRYREISDGDGGATVVEEGNEVTLYYKILKLGKRSYDGISGEGTVVFSRGYGLEDDEKAPGSKSFVTTVGSDQNVKALNDGILGMHRNGIRRFAILPQKGWEKPTKLCDGGPGGSGAGGDIRTDYVVVPTATMVSTESCFDTAKLPFPTTYAEQRRMAQRFDQSLIMEVQVVGISK